MTIKEVEEKTGLARSNIRFYEKERLICPKRNERNQYREYSEADVEALKKIAYLRTLGLPVEEIRGIISGEIGLKGAVERQVKILDQQINDLKNARRLCEKMSQDQSLTYASLVVERYVNDLDQYWKSNEKMLGMDAFRFVSLWGGRLAWLAMLAISFLIAVIAYPKLPSEIPIQYSAGMAVSTADKLAIFAYPGGCLVVRPLFKIIFRWKMGLKYGRVNGMIADYLTNSLCFILLSAEIFCLLFMGGYVKNAGLMFALDGLILMGGLVIGLRKKS